MDKLNDEQEREMNTWLKSNEFDQVFDDREPSDRMDMKFYEMLNRNRKPVKERQPLLWFFRLALPMLVLGITFYLGQQFSSQPEQQVITEDFASELLTTEDVEEKINLVSNTKIQDNTDQKVIEALLFSLGNDESVNVRLACINTLYDYAYLPKVRTGLIQSISNQQSPIVLANLAQAINASGKKFTKEEFMELIDKNLPLPIKSTIDASLIKI